MCILTIISDLLCRLVRLRLFLLSVCSVFFFQAEDGIRDLVRSRGLGDVYKRQFGIPWTISSLTETQRAAGKGRLAPEG